MLSGRFPNRLSTSQPDGANFCSDFLPLNATLLSEKLAPTYESYFVGKGHLGYQTDDHLPVNRGFKSHVGFLGGSEKYHNGGGPADPTSGSHDLWENLDPALKLVPNMTYSSNYYTQHAVDLINQQDKNTPFFMYFAIQNVHSPYELPPAWEERDYPEMWDHTYANMLAVLDGATQNLTDALHESGRSDPHDTSRISS